MADVCSLREAMAGDARDATLTHIIHELRGYKKRLVEQIDARRTRPTPHDDRRDHPPTPPRAACPKPLPDVVRSTQPAAAPRPATIWNPALTVAYSVDASGALDLSARGRRESLGATVTASSVEPVARPPSSDADEVLDLSCRRPPASFSPPTMTSSLRRPEVTMTSPPEVELSRGRRGAHNRKSSSAAAAAAGLHDDHDNPLCWSVRDVIEFVSEVPGCRAYAEVLGFLLT